MFWMFSICILFANDSHDLRQRFLAAARQHGCKVWKFRQLRNSKKKNFEFQNPRNSENFEHWPPIKRKDSHFISRFEQPKPRDPLVPAGVFQGASVSAPLCGLCNLLDCAPIVWYNLTDWTRIEFEMQKNSHSTTVPMHREASGRHSAMYQE